MRHGVFVTGTDTGVGKTLVTAALCRYLVHHGASVGVMKPIETGVASPASAHTDAVRLKAAASSHDELSLIRPHCFRMPVAPLTASRIERKPIDLKRVAEKFRILSGRHAVMLIEGVGGLHVPLTDSHDVIDLIVDMKLPAIVIGRAGLGGINHARLTIEALRGRNVEVLALVLNQTVRSKGALTAVQERSTAKLLRERLDVRVIGPLPYFPRVNTRWDHAVGAMASVTGIKQLALAIHPSG